jgi:hypothetical protein
MQMKSSCTSVLFDLPIPPFQTKSCCISVPFDYVYVTIADEEYCTSVPFDLPMLPLQMKSCYTSVLFDRGLHCSLSKSVHILF